MSKTQIIFQQEASGISQGDYILLQNETTGEYKRFNAAKIVVPELPTKSITENGTYNAEGDGKIGWSEVVVNVPASTGTYEAVRVWTCSPSSYDASLYVQHGNIENGIFVSDSTAITVYHSDLYTEHTYYNMIALSYNAGDYHYSMKAATNNLTDAASQYNSNNSIRSWTYSEVFGLVIYKLS